MERLPTHQKVSGSIPSHGTNLVCRFISRSGRIQKTTDQFFSHIDVSLSPKLIRRSLGEELKNKNIFPTHHSRPRKSESLERGPKTYCFVCLNRTKMCEEHPTEKPSLIPQRRYIYYTFPQHPVLGTHNIYNVAEYLSSQLDGGPSEQGPCLCPLLFPPPESLSTLHHYFSGPSS